MTSIGSASLAVIPDFDGFGNRVQRGVNGPLTAAGVSGGRRFGDAAGRSAGARFGSVFKTAAKAGILGGLAVAATAVKLGSDAIGEAREAQKVGRLTAAVIKSTGGAAKVSEKRVGKLSERLSEMAGIDDEIVQGGANTLLTFKNIRNEAGKGNKVFDEATKAALNLSVGLGRDLTGTAIQVGKALNDPIRGVTALSRAGVQFSDQQKDQIKTLTESGDLLGAQKIILGELTTQFDGAAKSQANSSERLGVAFDNVKEKLGKALLPVLDDVARFLRKEAIPAAEDFVGWFQDEGIPGIKTFADEVKPLANKFLPAAADGFRAIRDFGKAALPYAEGIVGAFNDMPSWAKKVLVGGAVAGIAANKIIPGGLSGIRGATPVTPMYVKVVGGLPGTPDGGGSKPGGFLAGLTGFLKPATLTKVPWWAKANPFAAGPSAPGQDSLLRDLTGVGPKGDDMALPDWRLQESAYKRIRGQHDLTKATLLDLQDTQIKWNSQVDKTPRQVEVLFKSKGYLERMREIELLNAALANVGAGGVPNVGADESPRGFGAGEYGVFAGANVNITANSTAEIAAEARRAKRKAARGGHG
jgi:hypothetical protein